MFVSFFLLLLASGQVWTPIEPDDNFQPLVADMGSVFYDNTIVSHGGLTKDDVDAPKVRVSTVWQNDLETRKLTKRIDSAGPPRAYHMTSKIGNTMWSFGGKCGGDPLVNTGYCNDVVSVNMDDWTFEHVTDFNGDVPIPRYAHSQESDGTDLYVFGGASEFGGVLNDLWKLDTVTMAWTEIVGTGDLPPSVAAPRIALMGGDLFMFGGKDDRGIYGNSLYALDLETMVWTSDKLDAAKLKPVGRQYHTLIAYQDYLIMMAGGIKNPVTNEKTFWNDLWAYSLESAQWIELKATNAEEDMPMVRWCHTLMAGDNGEFYIHGRSSNEGFDNDYWAYTHQDCAASCGEADGRCFLGTCGCPARCAHVFVDGVSGCDCRSAEAVAVASPLKFADTQIGEAVLGELERLASVMTDSLLSTIVADFQYQELMAHLFMSVPFADLTPAAFQKYTDQDLYWKSGASYVAFARMIEPSDREAWEANCTARAGEECVMSALSTDDWSEEATVARGDCTGDETCPYMPIEFLSVRESASRRLGSMVTRKDVELFGYDLKSSETRRAAIAQAGISGKRTISKRIMMTKEVSVPNFFGVSVYYPLYEEVERDPATSQTYTAYRTTPGGTESYRVDGKVVFKAVTLGEYSIGEVFERVLEENFRDALESLLVSSIKVFLFDAGIVERLGEPCGTQCTVQPSESFLAMYDPSPDADPLEDFMYWAERAVENIQSEHTVFKELVLDERTKWLVVVAADLPCPPTTMAQPDSDTVCMTCPGGFTCPGMVQLDGDGKRIRREDGKAQPGAPEVSEGFTALVDAPSAAYRCLGPMALDRCPGGAPGTCLESHGGVACAECAEGHFWAADQCIACDDSAVAAWAGLVLFLVAFVLGHPIVYLFCNSPLTAKTTTLAGVGLSFGLVINTVQTVGALRSLSIEWPASMKAILDVLAVLSLDFGVLLKLDCIIADQSAATAFAPGLFLPVGMFVGFGSMCLASHFVLSKVAPKLCVNRNKVFNTYGQVLSAVYIAIAKNALAPLRCYAHPLDGSTGEQRFSLVEYPSLLCYTPEHQPMFGLGIVAVLLYPVGIFAVSAYLVRLTPALEGDAFRTHLERARFLLARFRPDRYYWGLLFMLRNFSIALVPVVFMHSAVLQAVFMGVVVVVALVVQIRWWAWRLPLLNYIDSGALILLAVMVILGAVTIQPLGESVEMFVVSTLALYGVLMAAMLVLCVVDSLGLRDVKCLKATNEANGREQAFRLTQLVESLCKFDSNSMACGVSKLMCYDVDTVRAFVSMMDTNFTVDKQDTVSSMRPRAIENAAAKAMRSTVARVSILRRSSTSTLPV